MEFVFTDTVWPRLTRKGLLVIWTVTEMLLFTLSIALIVPVIEMTWDWRLEACFAVRYVSRPEPAASTGPASSTNASPTTARTISFFLTLYLPFRGSPFAARSFAFCPDGGLFRSRPLFEQNIVDCCGQMPFLPIRRGGDREVTGVPVIAGEDPTCQALQSFGIGSTTQLRDLLREPIREFPEGKMVAELDLEPISPLRQPSVSLKF